MNKLFRLWALFTVSFSLLMAAAPDSQKIVIDHSLQIPGEICGGKLLIQPGRPIAIPGHRLDREPRARASTLFC